jgi:hypothetical protein
MVTTPSPKDESVASHGTGEATVMVTHTRSMRRSVLAGIGALTLTATLVTGLPASAAPAACTVFGTDGNDVFQAADHPADAVICGGKGDDTIIGTFRGTFLGGPGSDTVRRNKGTFHGGAGGDHVRHNLGNGVFHGGPGNDSVSDNGGMVHPHPGTFYGGDGHDTVLSNYGTFRGGPGRDRVRDNYGTFHGGRGANHVERNFGTFYGGPDGDLVDLNGTVSFDGPNAPPNAPDELSGTFHGRGGDDRVRHNDPGDPACHGGRGNDTVDYNGSLFRGGPGNDHVDRNVGSFYGGRGYDTVRKNTGMFKPGPQ